MARKHKQPTIPPRVSDALRDHAALIRWYEKPIGKRYLRGFSQIEGLNRQTFRMMALDGDKDFPDYMLHMLRVAETFAITPEMHSLIERLAQGETMNTVPPEISLHDMPAMDGFVRLPEPIWSRDVAAVDYPIRAILWHTDPNRRFTEPGTLELPKPEEVSNLLPVTSVCLFNSHWPGDPVIKETGAAPPGPGLDLLHFGPFNTQGLHDAWEPGFGAPVDVSGEDLAHYQMPARYMVLFWLIANQKIASTQTFEGPSVGGISSLRAREAKIVPRIRVITLRSERVHSEEPTDGSGREYSHRWVVRAHWRSQACGPRHQDRRWVLVRLHTRGPEDKPLIIKERAFDLRR